MNKILDQIIDNRIPCLFISPHLDDAILSATGVISYLSGKTETTVMTVFSEEGLPPYSLSARAYLRQCGYNQVKSLYQDRRQEDKKACQQIGSEAVHLGFEEAMYRQKQQLRFGLDQMAKLIPEIKCLYPIYRWHVVKGQVRRGDNNTIQSIKGKMLNVLHNYDNCYLFAPLAVGGHVDHVIVRDVCASLTDSIIYWTDQPYIEHHQPDRSFVDKNGLVPYSWQKNLDYKPDIVGVYKTQFKALFPVGYQVRPEQYYFKIR